MRWVSWLFSVSVGQVPWAADVVERLGDRGAHRLAVPRRQQEVEREALVELVGPGVQGEDVGPPRRVGLGDQHQVAIGVGGHVVVDDRPPPPPHVVALGPEAGVRVELAGPERGQSGSAGSLPTGHTASTRNPSTPRSNQKRSVSANISSTAGWRWSKSGWYGVNVPRYHSGSSPPTGGPHRPAERGRPVVRRSAVAARSRNQNRARSSLPGRGGEGRLEPRVLAAAVVRARRRAGPGCRASSGVGDEAVEVGEVAVVGVDVEVVGDVVAVVALRRRVDRAQPDGVDAERRDVVEPAAEALEVADAVTVGCRRTTARTPGRRRRAATSARSSGCAWRASLLPTVQPRRGRPRRRQRGPARRDAVTDPLDGRRRPP